MPVPFSLSIDHMLEITWCEQTGQIVINDPRLTYAYGRQTARAFICIMYKIAIVYRNATWKSGIYYTCIVSYISSAISGGFEYPCTLGFKVVSCPPRARLPARNVSLVRGWGLGTWLGSKRLPCQLWFSLSKLSKPPRLRWVYIPHKYNGFWNSLHTVSIPNSTS